MVDGLGQLVGLLPVVVGAVRVVVAAVPPVPGTKVDEPSFDPNDVTPGLTGFLVTAGMVVLVILLLIDMARRLRRLKFRGELEQERVRAEKDAAAPAGEGPAPGEPDVVVPDADRLAEDLHHREQDNPGRSAP